MPFIHPLFGLSSDNKEFRTLYVKDFVCDAAIGAHQFEMGRTQKIVLNLVVWVATPTQPVDDNLANVLDYSLLRQAMQEIVGARHVHLQETICDLVANFCLSLSQVESVYVRVGKLEAFSDCEAVGCELLRHRKPPQDASGHLAP